MAPLSEQEIDTRLQALPGWRREGGSIASERTFGNFVEAVAWVERIVPVAEAMNHHPDLHISWDTVRIELTTHSEGGLTEADFALAERLDAVT